jgi:hypothetical protein
VSCGLEWFSSELRAIISEQFIHAAFKFDQRSASVSEFVWWNDASAARSDRGTDHDFDGPQSAFGCSGTHC